MRGIITNRAQRDVLTWEQAEDEVYTPGKKLGIHNDRVAFAFLFLYLKNIIIIYINLKLLIKIINLINLFLY